MWQAVVLLAKADAKADSGKHTSGVDFSEAKKIHPRFKSPGDKVLGSGAFGVVEKVHYTHNNRSVGLARKWIRYRRNRTIEMLREEARVMERLDHEHVVKLVGTYAVRTGELYILLWPVAACNLTALVDDLDALRSKHGDRDDIIKRLSLLELRDFSAFDVSRDTVAPLWRREGCPLKYLHQIIGCITEAVAYCHREDIRHLDLKPSNILLTPGKVYLADFGIAKDVNGRDHTRTLGKQGSPKWLAPEIFDYFSEWSMKAADIYALGLVLLDVSTVLYGGSLAEFDEVLDEPDLVARAARLTQYQAKLQLSALATQEYADIHANTFAPKHLVHLTSQMLATNPRARPTAAQVDVALAELGGIEQIYHSPCCRKDSRDVTRLMDTRYKIIADETSRLRQENERMARRLSELEGRDETYQMRLENERKQHSKNMALVRKQLQEEQEERKRLEVLVSETQGGRRHRPALPRPDWSAGGGQNGGLMMRIRPHHHTAHVNGTGAAAPSRPQAKAGPTVSFHAKTQVRSISPDTLRQPEPLARVTTHPPIVNGTAIPRPGSGQEGFPLRSRGSGSRLPVAVNPSTPIRSRCGTPSLARDPSLTDSTQFSMTSSTFSRISAASRESESAAPSPALGGSPFVKHAPIPPVPSNPSLGLGIAGSVDGSAKEHDKDTASVASSAMLPGTASPLLSGSAFSSPRTARVELDAITGQRIGVPSLPTAKSWAEVARRERR